MITSAKNPKIKQIRELQAQASSRRETGLFIIEGVRLVEEALAVGWPVEAVYYTDDLNERGQSIIAGFQGRGVTVEAVTAQVMKSASDTHAPQGILAIARQRSLGMPEKPDFVFIPDGVRDPGNLGTMLRSAAGAGAQLVLLPTGTVDAFAPKVVRAGMGAHFRLPLYSLEWAEIEAYIHQKDLTVYLADIRAEQLYYQADLTPPLALMVGGEAEGASSPAQRLADERLMIPMPGQVESLNAAVAAAVLMFEVVRQRQIRIVERCQRSSSMG